MTDELHGLDTEWPICRIDSDGQRSQIGGLGAQPEMGMFLNGDWPQCLQQAPGAARVPGLPWFLSDMRPQGFLGRRATLADACAPLTVSTSGPVMAEREAMCDAHIVASLCRRAHGVGQFIVGGTPRRDAVDAPAVTVEAADRAVFYGGLAVATLSGALSGPLVGGEQPKFTTIVIDADGAMRHVIVKFTEPADSSPAARRWADLLVAEHVAAGWLQARGLTSAATELVWSDRRLCLEVTRFDRIGAYGRRGCITLAAWRDGHGAMCKGPADDWCALAGTMASEGWLTAADVRAIKHRWWFGQLIGNDHMHGGNLGFLLNDALPLTLAPGYDMLPMMYRPDVNGVVPKLPIDVPMAAAAEMPYWEEAAAWADDYWAALSEHAMISATFRTLCAANHRAVRNARQRVVRAAGAPARREARLPRGAIKRAGRD